MSDHLLHLRELQTEAMDAPTYTHAEVEAAVKRALKGAQGVCKQLRNGDEFDTDQEKIAVLTAAVLIGDIAADPAQIAAFIGKGRG